VTDRDLGLVGFTIMGTGLSIPPNHSSVEPFYDLCKTHNVPVHVLVGYTGWGAGFDGGRGYYQDYCHPRYLDRLAADHPDLKIIASRPAWPWQSEMIASIIHKGNIVGYELHGWKPQYFPDELKDDLSYRLKDKAMFGADYPLFEYDELFEGWEQLDLDDELMERIRYKNAERILSEHFDYEL
jgi:predicted TIM-barrel fold metal-dependent hydrolase